MPTKKFLVVRFSSIGDIVLTSPVVRALSVHLGAEVHFLTKDRFAGLLSPNPYISKVYAISTSVREVSADLRRERYDGVVDLHVNLRSFQVRRLLGVQVWAFRKLNLQKWMLTTFGIDCLPRVHIVDRYLDAVAGLGIGSDGKGLDFFIPPKDEVDVAGRWSALSAVGGRFIAFCIGATHATKRLPIEKIQAVCALLPLPVILLGGADMAEEGRLLEEGGGPQVINTCGKLSIFESASVLRQAAVVITHDTGMMHIAAAFGKPIVSVWGNTVPEFGMTPYDPTHTAPSVLIQVEGLSCRPCSKIGHARCPKSHFKCMRDIRISQITEGVMQCLGQTEN